MPQGPSAGSRSTASARAARTHPDSGSSASWTTGAWSRRKRSMAATTAAASSWEADVERISSCGRRLGTTGLMPTPMADVPILSREAILASVDADEAIARVRDAFVRHRRGEWVMPAKVYLDSPPHGDFRAMPARGGDLAMLKWISSFPDNPRHGLPTVIGVLVVSDARTSEPLAILDAGAGDGAADGAPWRRWRAARSPARTRPPSR